MIQTREERLRALLESWPTASCCGEPRVSPLVDACYDCAKVCPECDMQPMASGESRCPWCAR